MPTRNVVLTDDQHQIIDTLVNSGRYQNASEVLREGLRMIERREADDAARLEALRQAINVGFTDLDAGRYVDVREDALAGHIASLGLRAAARTPGDD